MKLRLALLSIVFFVPALKAAAQVPHSSHVWIIGEENHSYESVTASMPYLMKLANQYGLATQYYADMHNSLSTLMHLVAGQTITLNDNTTATFSQNNLVRTMLSAGRTFKLYEEELPYAGFLGISYNEYVKRHNPLAYFSDVANSSLKYQNVPFTQLATDLAGGGTANLNYITPDLLDDGHDGTMAAADNWLQQHVPSILAQPEFQPGGDGLMFIIFDEGNLSTDNRCNSTLSSGCGGRVAAVVIGPRVKPGFKSGTWYDHESLLKTVCLALGVTCPGAAQNAPPMTDFFPTRSTSTTAQTMNMVPTLPVTGSSVAPGFQVAACATSANTITGWHVYIDSTDAWHSSNSVQCISPFVSAGLGTHTITARAWDSSGASTSQTQTVTVPIVIHMTSPTQGETVGSSVQVVASASSLHTIVAWHVYVDGTDVWHTGQISSIDASITLSTGTHTITVRAWDSTGFSTATSAKVSFP